MLLRNYPLQLHSLCAVVAAGSFCPSGGSGIKCLEAFALDPDRLKGTFEMWWPKLDAELVAASQIPAESTSDSESESEEDDIRPTKEILEEILQIVRENRAPDIETVLRQYGIATTAVESMSPWQRVRQLRDASVVQIREGILYFTGDNSAKESYALGERIPDLFPHGSIVIQEDDEGHRMNITFDPPFSEADFKRIVHRLKDAGWKIASASSLHA